jgi:hypothetical protein
MKLSKIKGKIMIVMTINMLKIKMNKWRDDEQKRNQLSKSNWTIKWNEMKNCHEANKSYKFLSSLSSWFRQ